MTIWVKSFMKWATCLPMWGKQLTHLGQGACPKWARVVPKTVPKVSIERNVSKGMQSANITDSFLLMRNQKSILIDSQIYLFRVVVVVSPAFSRDTNQKMKHGLHGEPRIGLSRIFFDIIELMILGFWFSRICKCLGTSFFDMPCDAQWLSDIFFQSPSAPSRSPPKGRCRSLRILITYW